MSLTSRKLWFDFFFFHSWESRIQLAPCLNSGVLVWAVRFPWHKEMNVRLFCHITGPRKLLSLCYLNKYPLNHQSRWSWNAYIFQYLSIYFFQHLDMYFIFSISLNPTAVNRTTTCHQMLSWVRVLSQLALSS